MKKWSVTLLALAGLSGAVLQFVAADHPLTAQQPLVIRMQARRNRAPSPGSSPGYLAPAAYWISQADTDSLVANSKRAIIETGISEAYFDEHFNLIRTVNDPVDRRVEWSFSVNEYQAQLVDAIGFHATGGKRAPVHGIKNQLYATHEIVKTLPIQRARRILRSCIGKFESESVIYRTLTVPGKARLYLTGRSIPERKREREPKDPDGEQEGQFLYVGFVDVETGKCVKKLGRGSS